MMEMELPLGARRISRRALLVGTASAAGAAWLPVNAFAQAAPHVFRHGDFEVTVLSDGHLVLPVSILAPEAPPEELAGLIEAAGQGPDELRPAANVPLIRNGSDLILIDTGSGRNFQPTAGKLPESLAAAGVDPAAITKVVFSHGHPDHIWGTVTDDGTPVYPNASYYVGVAEWNFWTDRGLAARMPAEMQPFVTGAQRQLSAVKDKITTVKPGDDIATGLRVVDSAGHTPGHLSFVVAGDGGLLITADAITNEVVFFAHPEWRFGFDADPEQAITNRKALLDRAATDKMKMLGFHWKYPGVGFAERYGTAYRFVPAS
jgi:glyoxylase-like metal-dependent hydrolase (beta-lactamase superfamily II)